MSNRLVLGDVTVNGVDIDEETRCRHWHSALDIVALRFACCGEWFSCFDCHSELVDHDPAVWPRRDFGELAAMCGGCGRKISVTEYTGGDSACIACGREFNPSCEQHYHLYFERD